MALLARGTHAWETRFRRRGEAKMAHFNYTDEHWRRPARACARRGTARRARAESPAAAGFLLPGKVTHDRSRAWSYDRSGSQNGRL